MPTFEVMYPDNGLSTKRIDASIIEYAAEKFAAERDAHSWDYTLLQGNTQGILIREEDTTDDWQYFELSGESSPVYSAELQEPPHESKEWKEILEHLKIEPKND